MCICGQRIDIKTKRAHLMFKSENFIHFEYNIHGDSRMDKN